MQAKHLLTIILAMFAIALPAAAQQTTPVVVGQTTPIPATATPGPDDARLSLCTAPSLDGFVPHLVRPGERLADLLTGTSNISVTQLAALNCLDDPAALPVGAVVWIPGAAVEAVDAGDENTPPSITRFTSRDRAIQNQDEITFRWQAVGEVAYFYACPDDLDSECERPALTAPVELNGEATLSDFAYAGLHRFRLEVRGAGESVTEDLTVEITCSQQWLSEVTGFSDCPENPPLAVFAAWQPFEGGVLIWFSDTREIWVMTNDDHRVQVFPDTYLEGEPSPDVEAPEDRYPAVRGFGRVWIAVGGPDGPLGWALSEETGFDSARQSAGSRSFTTYIQGPGETVYAVTLIPQLNVGLWTTIAG